MTTRSWAKGNKKIVDYYTGEVDSWAMHLRLITNRFLRACASKKELLDVCRKMVVILEKELQKEQREGE